MRVSVHQGKDGDLQSVPKLPHHQPAVYIWEPFTLTTHTHKDKHTHTCVKVYAWYWKMPLRNVSCPLMAVNDYHGHNQVSKYAQNIEVRPTVIMIQGQSFEQKSSSINLWNVASFSTMRTNLAEDTISGK